MATTFLALKKSLAAVQTVATDKRALSIGRMDLALRRRPRLHVIVQGRPCGSNRWIWVKRDRESDRRASRTLRGKVDGLQSFGRLFGPRLDVRSFFDVRRCSCVEVHDGYNSHDFTSRDDAEQGEGTVRAAFLLYEKREEEIN